MVGLAENVIYVGDGRDSTELGAPYAATVCGTNPDATVDLIVFPRLGRLTADERKGLLAGYTTVMHRELVVEDPDGRIPGTWHAR